jgi:hypothetical protein
MIFENIISGEKIQQLADVYLGLDEDFTFNPVIREQQFKAMKFDVIINRFDNPAIVFCYTHRVGLLATKIDLFLNNFILITHNSDHGIHENDANVLKILNNTKLQKWFGQNITFIHDKLHMIPIGIANSQWEHGIQNFNNHINIEKKNDVYFNFNVTTNYNKRQNCYEILRTRLNWLENVTPRQNIERLAQYKFCICPEGNGFDTHRLWEALYVKTVPILLKSEYSQILAKYNVPMVVLESWNDLNIENLNYNDYDFENIVLKQILNFEEMKKLIQNS